MALVAVLWIVAALSVLVTGMTKTVRGQIMAAGVQRDAVTGRARAEAAIALALQTAMIEPQPNQPKRMTVFYQGQSIDVDMVPLNGLVPLNGASVPLLRLVLQVAGGLPTGKAEELAHTIVRWREGAAGDPRPRNEPFQFESVEDLMLVPGVDYALFARVAPWLNADDQSGSRVNPLAAPVEVLTILAEGNASRATQIAAQRAEAGASVDTTTLDAGMIGIGSTLVYRLTAGVPLEDGKILYFSRDLVVGVYRPRTAPWRILRSQWQIQPASPPAP